MANYNLFESYSATTYLNKHCSSVCQLQLVEQKTLINDLLQHPYFFHCSFVQAAQLLCWLHCQTHSLVRLEHFMKFKQLVVCHPLILNCVNSMDDCQLTLNSNNMWLGQHVAYPNSQDTTAQHVPGHQCLQNVSNQLAYYQIDIANTLQANFDELCCCNLVHKLNFVAYKYYSIYISIQLYNTAIYSYVQLSVMCYLATRQVATANLTSQIKAAVC